MKHAGGMADFEGKMSSVSGETLRSAQTAEAALAQWKRPLVGAATIVGLLMLVFWDFFAHQVRLAIEDQADYGHILVVPFIAGYFVYLNRERLLAVPFRTTWFGLAPVILGVGWYILCQIGPQPLRHANLQSVGVITTIGGLSLLFFGWRSMAWLWFPLLYLFMFGQGISERFMSIVTYRLQDITARGAHLVMVVGMDVERSGNTLFIFHNGETKPLNIAEACSGMRMLMAFLALGVAMAYTGFKRYWQRVALVLMAFPTAIFVNVLRVTTLGILSLFDTGLAEGDFHSFIGLVWLVPAFFIFLGLMWVIRQLVHEDDQGMSKTVVRGAS
jgi:exosortase